MAKFKLLVIAIAIAIPLLNVSRMYVSDNFENPLLFKTMAFFAMTAAQIVTQISSLKKSCLIIFYLGFNR